MPGDGRGRGANYPGLTPTATATNGNIGRIPDAGDLVAAALAYCAAGWSVIPCRVTGKRSLVRWKLWQQTAPDPEQLVIWWRRWPRANLAAITGRVSGVVVVDVDPRHGGDHALAELERQHGDLPWLAVVETPSGGWHVYLRHPGGRVANSVGRIGVGVDVRGDGGIALLPPSRRLDGAYRWAVGGPATVPELPAAWVELVRPLRRAAAATRTALEASHVPGGPRGMRPGSPGCCGRCNGHRKASVTACCSGAAAGCARWSGRVPRRAGPTCWSGPVWPPGSTWASAVTRWRPRWAATRDRRP